MLAFRLVRLPAAGWLFEPPRPEPALQAAPAAESDAEEALAQTLLRQMGEHAYYRDESLSVARLAEHLQLPEYRLRRLINQRLGQRNFNSFVNGFRLAEAKQVLADPARRSTAVLNVALDAGFGSIGPFNRAFKADTGLTPSEFRRQNLADS
jgi:AraC-like DNA-binding protein